MENAIKNGEDENNYKEYLNQWEFAKKRNDRYDIIKYIINYKKRKSNNNNNINENDFIQTAQTWDNLEKEIGDKKIKKMRREDKIMMYNYFNDANNRETILKIFNQDIIQYFNEHYMDKSINKEKKDEINDINKLNEILNYYKNYLFISKKNQINILEEIVRNKNGNYNEYLKDYDIAKKMNERYDIINYLYESKNKNIIRTEENFNKSVQKWEQLEKLIKNRKYKKMRNDDKQTLAPYFSDENKKNILLRIFNEDDYEYFLKENKNKINNLNKYNYNNDKLNEILNYYKSFLFETKKNEIILIENYFKNNTELINYEQYLQDLENAKKMNDKYDIINYLYESKSKDKNIQKTEKELNVIIKSWEGLEKQIKDKKIKKMRKDDKEKLYKYFNDINNKVSLLKIFNQESIDYFINEMDKINSFKEILKYYENFLFESKKEEITGLKNAIKKGEIDKNYEKNLEDKDKAKKWNERFPIIKFLFDYKNHDIIKTEKEFENICKDWEFYEKCISNKKIKKIKREDKNKLLQYFNDQNNENILLNIFKKEAYEYFINNKQTIDTKKLSNLKEINTYYKQFLFDSKKDDIILIENAIRKGENLENIDMYLNDLEIAQKMNLRYDIINYLYEKISKNVEKTEKNFEKSIKKWSELEKQISDQKISKMRKDDKKLLYDYFKEKKEYILSIFNENMYEHFMKDCNNKMKKEDKKENIHINDLNEI